MDKKFIAHITCINNETRYQTIEEHSRSVAKLTAQALKENELYNVGYLAGILHDMGKFSDKFAAYIEKSHAGENVRRGSVNHTFAGVIYMLSNYHLETKRSLQTMTCEIISYVIGAHHGEFDVIDIDGNNGFLKRLNCDREKIEYELASKRYFENCCSKEEIDQLFQKAVCEVNTFLEQYKKSGFGTLHFCLGIVTRMILSCLIDADRSDTAFFMNYGKNLENQNDTTYSWNAEVNFFEKKISEFSGDTEINKQRSIISEQCYKFAQNGNGIYKLCVPTGSGKTLATYRYALHLAQKENKNRIIFIIPLLSVLDQNSKVIREFTENQEIILEHHSNMVQADEDIKESLSKQQLVVENWDSKIIISTLYQLLMIMFTDKTTYIRRLKSLQNSVVIIDEVQSIPSKTIDLFNATLNALSFFFKTTFVLSSATMPCFENADQKICFSQPCDMVVKNKNMLKVFKRVNIINKVEPYGTSKEQLCEFAIELLQHINSVLIICNTKEEAKTIFEYLKNSCDQEYVLFHLSTSMCAAHRVRVLNEINECLSASRKGLVKMVCVSTQLVEAGIDFSFESVIRVLAGLDSIAQAAGRCNRNDEYGHICNMYVMKLKNENLKNLKEIELAKTCMEKFILSYNQSPKNFDNDWLSDKSINSYYQMLFGELVTKNDLMYPIEKGKYTIFRLLSDNKKNSVIQKTNGFVHFLPQAFKEAGQDFCVYDCNTTDVIVPYNDEAKEIITDLCSQKANYSIEYVKNLLKKAKPYTIQLWDYQIKSLENQIDQDENGYFMALSPGCYDSETGLSINKMFW